MSSTNVRSAFDYVRELSSLQLFTLGGAPFTAVSLLGLLSAAIALCVLANWVRRCLEARLARHAHLAAGTRETIATLSRYAVLALGTMIILDEAGIQPSSFTMLIGALGVGVGFGLQNIFSNFISGLIVMFEQPVKLGDHVSIGGVEGEVARIGLRATSLRTSQGSLVIVPNQNLITGSLVNWSDGVGGTAVLQWRMLGAIDESEALIRRVLKDHPEVLTRPEPVIYVVGIDHAGQVMEAHFCIARGAEARIRIISDIHRRLLAELERTNRTLAPNP